MSEIIVLIMFQPGRASHSLRHQQLERREQPCPTSCHAATMGGFRHHGVDLTRPPAWPKNVLLGRFTFGEREGSDVPSATVMRFRIEANLDHKGATQRAALIQSARLGVS